MRKNFRNIVGGALVALVGFYVWMGLNLVALGSPPSQGLLEGLLEVVLTFLCFAGFIAWVVGTGVAIFAAFALAETLLRAVAESARNACRRVRSTLA